MSAIEDALAHDGIVPDEVQRLRLEPGDRLIVRVADRWTPYQIRDYQEHLRAAFPDNDVLILIGEQVLTMRPGDRETPDREIAGVVTVGFSQTGELTTFADLEVNDAHTGESLIGTIDLCLRANPDSIAAEITEVLGESGDPIRQRNANERPAPSDDDRGYKTVTRTFLVASHRLGGENDGHRTSAR